MEFRDRMLVTVLLLGSVGFVCFLLAISLNDGRMLVLPLSEFRFGPWAAFGHGLFATLLAIGGIYIAVAFRFGDSVVQFVSLLSEILLIVVYVTPTFNALHELAAHGLLVLLYGYFAIRLYRANSVWIFAHLFIPVAIVASLMSASMVNYGMLQKSFICYLVLIVDLDCLLLTGSLALSAWRRKPKRRAVADRDRIRTPHVIYRRYS